MTNRQQDGIDFPEFEMERNYIAWVREDKTEAGEESPVTIERTEVLWENLTSLISSVSKFHLN